jgi:hypothetical protein
MEVVLKRAWQEERATLGMLTIKGVKHDPFYTLENPQRATSKDSLIPAGFYKCVPYSGTRFKDVYLVQNVPGRSAILFHWGNYERDTVGCILIGNASGMLGGRVAVLSSVDAFKRFRYLIGKKPFDLTIV